MFLFLYNSFLQHHNFEVSNSLSFSGSSKHILKKHTQNNNFQQIQFVENTRRFQQFFSKSFINLTMIVDSLCREHSPTAPITTPTITKLKPSCDRKWNSVYSSSMTKVVMIEAQKNDDGVSSKDHNKKDVTGEIVKMKDQLFNHRKTFAEMIFNKASKNGVERWSPIGDLALYYFDVFIHHHCIAGKEGLDFLLTLHPYLGSIAKTVMHDAADACLHMAKKTLNAPINYEDTLYVLTIDESVLSFFYDMAEKSSTSPQISSSPGAYLQSLIHKLNYSQASCDPKWAKIKATAMDYVKVASIEGLIREFAPPDIAVAAIVLAIKHHSENPFLSTMLALLTWVPNETYVSRCELCIKKIIHQMADECSRDVKESDNTIENEMERYLDSYYSCGTH